VKPGAEAPDFVLPASGGGECSLDDLTARAPALLVFFKTSCGTSRRAFPVFAELERRFGDVVPVVAVSQDPLDEAEDWLAQCGFSGRVLVDDSERYAVSAAYGLEGVPTAVLVDRDKTVLDVSVGWSRDAVNALARRLGRLTERDEAPVSTPADGMPPSQPG
jgi:peroxiredoxin